MSKLLDQAGAIDEQEVVEAAKVVAPKLKQDLEAMMAEDTKGDVLAATEIKE